MRGREMKELSRGSVRSRCRWLRIHIDAMVEAESTPLIHTTEPHLGLIVRPFLSGAHRRRFTGGNAMSFYLSMRRGVFVSR